MKGLILFLALFTFTSAYAAADSSNQPNSPATTNQTADAKKQDGQIIAVLIALNKNEIAAANNITSKNVSPAVKNYANLMRKDHSKNLQDTVKLSRKIGETPVPSDESKNLQEQGSQELAILRPLNNHQLEITYIDSMVKDHEAALDKVNQAAKDAQNPQLKKHLEDTSKTISEHLEKAKEIQNNLKSSS